MAGVEIGAGMYYFEPETDPVKIQQAEQDHQEWGALIREIAATSAAHGWDSDICQMAQMQLKEWQGIRQN